MVQHLQVKVEAEAATIAEEAEAATEIKEG
jgi:hypothetical protein